ncbi:hypothetical protein OQH60_06325 [Campylobacter sp. MIT 21-1685]|uniref:hypothetical protein n=1 Tax=unclassified Campylobacter TaxID=2593542 RepID=UPI00224B488D|nr:MULTISPECIES: hypothetical protein [unclassified Campylobacter]MCX2683481.1 hypothetical protein [Campylobacter sp. MIT 21-1684]MCX2751762.1 hypothetical protein [Campylobacter sp. MIT 21-1682]MCX2807963.1 hypothetical protein [Campylobacter sp. MIT 21-1685]
MKCTALILLALPLFATNLIHYNIYDRNDRVDLMLSFDNAYNGNISQKKEKDFILLTLNGLEYNKNELKDLNSRLINKISINSKNQQTYIMFQTQENIVLNVSSSNDKLGLRIRALPQETENVLNNELPKSKNTTLEGVDFTNYIIVILLLMLLFVVLWWLKRVLRYRNNGILKDFTLVFQRPLDRNNHFVVLEYNAKRYTLIIGNSHLLLESVELEKQDEKFERVEQTEKKFDSFFEENKRKIQQLVAQTKK